MNEIGGYFELEGLINNPYHENAIKLCSARAALAYLIKSKKITTLYIPLFLCNTVKEYISKFDVKIISYNVDEKFKPIVSDIKLNGSSYLYIVNYYGQLSREYIQEVSVKFKNIIIDNTHAFFIRPIPNVDTIYSCRKFFGVPDGAYLFTDKVIDDEFSHNKIINKLSHIIGRAEFDASSYYSNYMQNDLDFKLLPILKMSKYTHTMLGAIDYQLVQKIRDSNFTFLNQHLAEINKLEIKFYNGPYCYPLMLKDCAEVRGELIKNKVYVPILWSDALEALSENMIERQLITNILPIPCDQRYSLAEMGKIVNIISRSM